MAHLLLDTSPEVQKLAYPMLQNASQKRTEYLVIEAGVDTSENAKFELPLELLEVVKTRMDLKNISDPVRASILLREFVSHYAHYRISLVTCWGGCLYSTSSKDRYDSNAIGSRICL